MPAHISLVVPDELAERIEKYRKSLEFPPTVSSLYRALVQIGADIKIMKKKPTILLDTPEDM